MRKQYLLFLFIVLLQGFSYAQSRGNSYYKIEQNHLWGLMDSNRQIIIPCEYQRILFYSDSLIFYKHNDLWGFMNYKGKILVPATYSIELPNKSEHPLYWEVIAKTYGNDPNITPSGDYVPYFKKKQSTNIDEWGFDDALDTGFNQIEDEKFQEELKKKGFILVRSVGGMGALNLKGEEICPFVYDNIAIIEGSPVLFLIENEERFGLMNDEFQIILAPEYVFLGVWASSSSVWNSDFDIQYEKRNIIVAKDNGTEYDPHYFKYHTEDWTFEQNELAEYPTNWRFDLFNLKGDKISTQSYDMVSCLDFKDGNTFHAKVQVGEAFGIINAKGETVIPADYECIVPLDRNVYKVCKNNKWGVLNLSGKVLIPIEYDFIGNFHSYFNALAKKDGLYGVIDFNGKTLLPFQFHYLTRFDDTHFLYFEKDAYRLISIGKESPTFKEHVDWE